MRSSLPILIAAVLAALPAMTVLVRAQSPAIVEAQNAAAPPGIVPFAEAAPLQAAPQPAPDAILAEAIVALGRHRSIAAKIRHQAAFYGRDVIGSGDYLQGPTSSRLARYELRMQAGSRKVDFLEINDGQYLWRRFQLKEEPDVERIEVDRVLAALQQQAGGKDVDPAMLLTLGGLGRLLSALAADFEFTKSLPPGNLGNVPVYGLSGTWKLDALKRRDIGSPEQLRPHVPDTVVLYLGRDDLFPYRLEFHRQATGAGEGNAPNARVLLKLDLFDVRFDVPLDAGQFHFAAGHLPWVDITDRVLKERVAAGQVAAGQ